MFNFFVQETIWLYEIVTMHSWLFSVVYFAFSLANFIIFVHHENNLRNINFFMKHVTDFYDFNKKHYRFNRTICTFILPFSMFNVFLSIFQNFDSHKFLKRYG